MLPLSKAGRRYGRKRDFSDTRDYTVATAPVFRLSTAQLPPTCDLTAWCGPVKNQGEEGSCTGHAYSSIREFLARKYQGEQPILSPQFLYMEELFEEGTFPSDSGAQPRTGCVILNRIGCCEEGLRPYTPMDIYTPSQEMMDNAKLWIGGAYHRIASLPDVLSCLNSGYPCSVGFNVYESFEEDWLKPGVMPVPDTAQEELLGGHEVFACGYDLSVHDTGALLIQNSWGADWGLGGRFWMPFEVVKNADVVQDIWMCHLGRAWAKISSAPATPGPSAP
jgi:C1A family cysteine protease